MVLANLTEGSTDADTHAAPTVHLNAPSGPAVKAYAKKAGATATLKQGNLSSTPIRYPQVASSSSRGPSIGNAGDLLKPDISAPGVAILAAVAPASNHNRKFDFYSGTSMPSPHVSGVAALYFHGDTRCPTCRPGTRSCGPGGPAGPGCVSCCGTRPLTAHR